MRERKRAAGQYCRQPFTEQFLNMLSISVTFSVLNQLRSSISNMTQPENNPDPRFTDLETAYAFFASGVRYISNACDHPNVFRFVNVDDPVFTIGEQIHTDNSIFTEQFGGDAAGMLAAEYDAPPEAIGEMVRDTVIYTNGLAVMMMFDNYRLPKEEACRMIYETGRKLAKAIGIEV